MHFRLVLIIQIDFTKKRIHVLPFYYCIRFDYVYRWFVLFLWKSHWRISYYIKSIYIKKKMNVFIPKSWNFDKDQLLPKNWWNFRAYICKENVGPFIPSSRNTVPYVLKIQKRLIINPTYGFYPIFTAVKKKYLRINIKKYKKKLLCNYLVFSCYQYLVQVLQIIETLKIIIMMEPH